MQTGGGLQQGSLRNKMQEQKLDGEAVIPMKGKGIFAGLALFVFLTLLAVSMTVYAQENEGQYGSQLVLETVVKGQSAIVENNQGETVLPDGTAVTVEGETLPDSLLLVVELVSVDNADILAWIERCMQGKGTNLRAYDIYLVDSNGERYALTGQITVTISLDGAYTRPVVYYISEDGSTEKMDTSVRNDRISFATDHNSYYVLAETADEEERPTETPTEPAGTEAPTETEAPAGIEYPAVSGADSIWNGDGSRGISIKVPKEAGRIIKVTVDGRELSGDEYTVTGNPPTVTLKPEYLKTFSDGRHTILIQGENGYVETAFTVKKATKETDTTETDTTEKASGTGQSTGVKTGDETDAASWTTVLLLSLGILLAAGSRIRIIRH